MMSRESSWIRKNVLDLEYQKNLQYQNVTLVVLFTYYIGLILTYFSEELISFSWRKSLFLYVFTLFFSLLSLVYFKMLKEKQGRIIKTIMELEEHEH